MDRRSFIVKSALYSGGMMIFPTRATAAMYASKGDGKAVTGMEEQFAAPDMKYRPFVRWWWNGNRVQKDEIIRELRLLKQAGIGGVEINPVQFPEDTDDMNIPALQWLGDEWIDALQTAFDEARSLGMTCDLIVGSGWPFGGKFLNDGERAQIMMIGVKKLQGPMTYETSLFNILKEADPAISHPYSGRTPELVSLRLTPDPFEDMSQEIVLPLTADNGNGLFKIEIPEGKHAVHALVKINAFGEVINGAPGADGPTLNHFDRAAVEKYLTHMSDAIEKRTGPLRNHIRSLFTDSMEIEGANWTDDMAAEFQRRNGYDVMPCLPYALFKTGQMGSVTDYKYGVELSPALNEQFERMRFDLLTTKAEMLLERFTRPYVEWCRKLGVQSRAQAYGNGFFPLETSMEHDIPEGESWTTNWLQHRIGEEMSNEDYRRGRAYTMINKYVSSAAHLTGKRLVSAEEMTNTYRVFNMTLEFLKIGCDMNAIAGVTHSIYHGFNYSPASAPFPGWIRYGAFYSEKNNWWPYFKYINDYRARLSMMMQNADMFADVAILPPVNDMWTTIGMQNEPFPATLNVTWTSLVWEAMHKHGNGADYVSETVVRNASVKKGKLIYGKRSYSSLFIIETERMYPETLARLYEFASSGGKVFCIGKCPVKSLGWKDREANDSQTEAWMKKLQALPNHFITLQKPADNDFMAWYPAIQTRYGLTPFAAIENPDPYLMANRYVRDDGTEFFFFTHSHLNREHRTAVRFHHDVTRGRYAWIWNPDDGQRYRLEPADGVYNLYFGPADSRVIVFDKEKTGRQWNPPPLEAPKGSRSRLLEGWDAEFRHSCTDSVEKTRFHTLDDLKNTPYVNFTGTVVYTKKITADNPDEIRTLNLGKVWGVAEAFINGESCGATWYGNRIYDITGKLKPGENELEIRVITTMGNYIQTLADNKVAQKWTARPGRPPQPKQSMGLGGPVKIY